MGSTGFCLRNRLLFYLQFGVIQSSYIASDSSATYEIIHCYTRDSSLIKFTNWTLRFESAILLEHAHILDTSVEEEELKRTADMIMY